MLTFVGRSRILSDNSLKIENVEIGDDGVFVCRMENSFGSQEAEARVTVLCESRLSIVSPLPNFLRILLTLKKIFLLSTLLVYVCINSS